MTVPRSMPHVGSPYNKPGYNSRNIECKLIGTQNEHYFTRISPEEIKIKNAEIYRGNTNEDNSAVIIFNNTNIRKYILRQKALFRYFTC